MISAKDLKSLVEEVGGAEEAPKAEKTSLVMVEMTPSGAKALLNVLKAFKQLGDTGASAKLVFEENDKLNKQFALGFEGDGGDKILSITVDGEPFPAEEKPEPKKVEKEEKETEAEVELLDDAGKKEKE